MDKFLVGKTCVFRGDYRVVYSGEVIDHSDDLKVIRIKDAKQIRRYKTDDTSGGLAALFHGKVSEAPDIEKVRYNDGQVVLINTFEVIPLDAVAIANIEKGSH